MSDLVQLVVAIGGLAAFVTAVGTLVVGVRNSRKADDAALKAALAAERAADAKAAAEASQREIIATKEGVFEVGRQIDGRLSQLLETAKALAKSEGRAEGVAEVEARWAKALGEVAAAEKRVPEVAPVEVRVIQDPTDPAVRVKPEKK